MAQFTALAAAAAEAAGEEVGGDDARISVAVQAVIDTSGSMKGNKITAVKLGLCAMAAYLHDTDLFSISRFHEQTEMVTPGFFPVQQLRATLPRVLVGVEAGGGTAFYDAIERGLEAIHALSAFAPPNTRRVLIALTDGEDTSSVRSVEQIESRIADPGINNFMCIIMAVGMSPYDRARFQPWLRYRHMKQLSVDVQTGSTLVTVFKEVLMSRVYTTENERLYVPGRGPQMREEPAETVTGAVVAEADYDMMYMTAHEGDDAMAFATAAPAQRLVRSRSFADDGYGSGDETRGGGGGIAERLGGTARPLYRGSFGSDDGSDQGADDGAAVGMDDDWGNLPFTRTASFNGVNTANLTDNHDRAFAAPTLRARPDSPIPARSRGSGGGGTTMTRAVAMPVATAVAVADEARPLGLNLFSRLMNSLGSGSSGRPSSL